MFKRRASHTPAVTPSPEAGHHDVATLTDADFARGLAGAWTVVDFWAPWCGPCRQFAPRFERAAATHTCPLRFARCNVDTERLAAAQFGIVSIPTLGLFGPDGQLRDRLIGAPSSPALTAFLSQVPRDAALPAD